MTTDQPIFALTIKLPHIKENFFPIGTEEELRAIYEGNLSAAANTGVMTRYKLSRLPESMTDSLARASDKIKSVVSGDTDITLSTQQVVAGVKGTWEQLRGAGVAGRSAFSKALAGQKVDGINDLLPVATAGVRILQSVQSIAALRRVIQYVETDDYIVNEHGMFVSGAWLDDANNIEEKIRLRSVKPKITPKVV